MKKKTHFWASFAISLIATIWLDLLQDDLTSWLLLVIFLYFSSYLTGSLPNIIDRYICVDCSNRSYLTHCRHPLTHHPLTIFYFLPVLLLKLNETITNLFIVVIIVPWGVHLLLDALTSEGIPLGMTPILQQDISKHYSLATPTGSLHLSLTNNESYDRSTNLRISVTSRFIVLFVFYEQIINFSNNIDDLLYFIRGFYS